jgi:hypothetical protein
MDINIPASYDATKYTYGEEIGYIVHTIMGKYGADRRYEYGEPVPLRMEYLQQALHWKHAKPAVQEALDHWILDTNGSYVVGKHARRYSVHPAYLGERLVPYTLRNKFLARRIEKQEYGKEEVNVGKYAPIHHQLRADLRRIDYGQVLALTEDNLWWLAEGEYDKFNPLYTCINKIRAGQLFGVPCKNHRFHTTITNMKRELRQLLTIEGQPIIYRDISCSQPLLLSLYLRSCVHKNLPLSNTKPNQPPPTPNTPPYDTQIEIHKYQHEVEEGLFYDSAVKVLGKPRDVVKTQLLQVFFDRPRTNCIYTDYLRGTYPNILAIINDAKREDHRFLANHLQQIEAELVIHRICAGLKEDHPEIPLVTVHDSIGTMEPYESIVEARMRAEFAREGLNPTFKRE